MVTPVRTKSALVLFSGGQDSTTCLAWALSRYDRVETIGFSYGQRHVVELSMREPIRKSLISLFPHWADRLGADHLIPLDAIPLVSRSALTDESSFGMRPDGLPKSFVPGRNIVFLTFAAIVASQRELSTLVTGMCETDFSGYPHCRDDTIKALQVALNLGMESRLNIETPLMWIDKAETWALAEDLCGSGFIDLLINQTHTCYLGERSNLHAWGYGCATCDACALRARGWERYTSQRSVVGS